MCLSQGALDAHKFFFCVTQHNKQQPHQIQSENNVEIQKEHQRLDPDADLNTTAAHADTFVMS